MNKSLLIGVLATSIATGSLYSQGTITFANVSTNKVTRQDTGANVANSPAGGWKVALYWLPDGPEPAASDFDSQDATPLKVTNIGVPTPGMFSGGGVTVPTSTLGAFAWFQVRAWQAAYGATFAEVMGSQPIGGVKALAGTSNVFRVDLGDPSTVPPGAPGTLNAMNPIVLVPVPEPGAIALGLLGLGALLALRRRK